MNPALKSWFTDRALLALRLKIVDFLPKGGSVIEFGCGTGHQLRLAAKQLKSGIGVDSDPAMVGFAEKRAAKEGFSNLEFFCADAAVDLGQFKKADVVLACLLVRELDPIDRINF